MINIFGVHEFSFAILLFSKATSLTTAVTVSHGALQTDTFNGYTSLLGAPDAAAVDVSKPDDARGRQLVRHCARNLLHSRLCSCSNSATLVETSRLLSLTAKQKKNFEG